MGFRYYSSWCFLLVTACGRCGSHHCKPLQTVCKPFTVVRISSVLSISPQHVHCRPHIPVMASENAGAPSTEEQGLASPPLPQSSPPLPQWMMFGADADTKTPVSAQIIGQLPSLATAFALSRISNPPGLVRVWLRISPKSLIITT